MIPAAVAVILVSIVALFAAQNAMPVTLSFLFWKFEASLAVVIFLSLLAGMLLAATLLLSRAIRKALLKSKPSDPKRLS